MIETKIKKILPYWCLAISCIICLFFVTSVFQNGPTSPVLAADGLKNFDTPQVLGVSTDIRGKEVDNPVIPALFGPVDESRITAESYLVADIDSGVVLMEKNGIKQESIASLTKLLTGLLVYENLDFLSAATISPADILNISPSLHLQSGDSVRIEDLFNAMIIGSNNDAAVALANHVSEKAHKDFIDMMNERAQVLGMTNSHFTNPVGLESKNHYSTAEDLLKLVRATQKLSAFTVLGRKTDYFFSSNNGKNYKTIATNKLIAKHTDLEAIKTGYTEQAGQSMITKATKANHAVIILVLNSKDRDADTLSLEADVFAQTRWPQ